MKIYQRDRGSDNPIDPSAPKAKGEAKTYAIDFRNHYGERFRWSAYKDRRRTDQLAQMVEALVSCRTTGQPTPPDVHRWIEAQSQGIIDRLVKADLLDTQLQAASKPLKDHIRDYVQNLRDTDRADHHVKTVNQQLLSIVDGCGFKLFTDISAARIDRFLSQKVEDEGASVSTVNHYKVSVKSFCRWMIDTGKVSNNPVAMLKNGNARADRRRKRRALTVEEAARLIGAADNSPDSFFGLTGKQRAAVYQLALTTGLRLGEISSLTVSDFDLSAATVTVRAECSKNGKEDTLPLTADMVVRLRVELAGKGDDDLALKMPSSCNAARMLRLDLSGELVKGDYIRSNPYSAGIEYQTAAGVADFHSLRHTYITHLAQAGVSPAVAQKLARHSTVDLTMNCYSHIGQNDKRKAIEIVTKTAAAIMQNKEAETLKATGTTDVNPVNYSTDFCARIVPKGGQFGGISGHSLAIVAGSATDSEKGEKPLKNKDIPCFSGSGDWWARRDLNPRPIDYESTGQQPSGANGIANDEDQKHFVPELCQTRNQSNSDLPDISDDEQAILEALRSAPDNIKNAVKAMLCLK
jgi:integrase